MRLQFRRNIGIIRGVRCAVPGAYSYVGRYTCWLLHPCSFCNLGRIMLCDIYLILFNLSLCLYVRSETDFMTRRVKLPRNLCGHVDGWMDGWMD
ncbi:hypothetical protein F4774DRAFT_215512 [Daldinia eschscholtzii]|nr:hypothetical protein F4774DRAFT_215512 [Daldinia eschscholtzii]